MTEPLTAQYTAQSFLDAYNAQADYDKDVDKFRRMIYGMRALAEPGYATSPQGRKARGNFSSGSSSSGGTGMLSRFKLMRDEEQERIKRELERRQIEAMVDWEDDDDFLSWMSGQGKLLDTAEAKKLWETEKGQRRSDEGEKRAKSTERRAVRTEERAEAVLDKADLVATKSFELANEFVTDYSVDPTFKGERNAQRAIRARVINDDSIPKALKPKVIAAAIKRLKEQFGTVGRYEARGQKLAEESAARDVERLKGTQKTANEKDIVDAHTTMIVDKYAGRWRGQSAANQQAILAEIQREIGAKPLEQLPLELRSALFASVKSSLTQYGAMGAAYKEKKAEERTAVTQEREDIEFDQGQSDRAERVGGIAIAQGMADDVRTLVDGGMDREEAVRRVTDANIRTNFDEEEFKRLAELITTEVSPTQAKKIQLENERDLTPTDNLQVNLNNFNRVLDREMLRGPQADPFWYDHDVWMRRRIAIDHALAVFERVAPGVIDQEAINEGWNKLLEREEIVAHLDTLDDAAANEFLKRLLVHGYYTFKGGNALGVPLIIMQRIVYPEKFTPGKKKK